MEVEVKNVKKSYQGQNVLDIDQLTFHSGKLTAIVGPNGAGKSTLLNIIGDLLEKDEGEIFYNCSLNIPSRDMTLVFQQPYLLNRRVYDNIAYPLKIRKKNKQDIEKRVIQLAEDLHFQHLLHKKANHLSLGEIQKVSIARAIACYPQLLLLDEPCASLDPHTTSDIENMLMKMKNQTTILLVTHNLAQAKRIADEVVLLKEGKVIEKDNGDNFFYHPQQEETRQFIAGELLI